MTELKRINLPLTDDVRKTLTQNETVLLNGTVYTARDQAHKRIATAIKEGTPLPFPLKNSAIYYCGPTPAREGEIIGSCGPTTSGRMDAYTPLLIQNGLSGMIGKGKRSNEVISAIKSHGAVYFSAIGGAAALYKSCVKSSTLIAYPDLGCEAVLKLQIVDFPAVVTII